MTPADGRSLQERYAPRSVCFGCGPANEQGLHVRSFPAAERDAPSPATGGATGDASETVAEWQPAAHHEAFAGVLNGGIIGTLLDCHSNWTAATHLMRTAGRDRPPTTVTADYAIRLLRPTPTSAPVHLRARVVDSTADRATVEAEIEAGGQVTVTCRATFVAVRPGHPAYDRW
jgi:acyl-coenzyme A thioesterase PaaI-like protein